MHKQRLLQLADYLEAGKFQHEVFDFDAIDKGPPTKNGCGTAGCAMGELPGCFPEYWMYKPVDLLKRNESLWFLPCPVHQQNEKEYNCGVDVIEAVSEFFEISNDLIDHLFYPNYQNIERFGSVFIGKYASERDVAQHIRNTIQFLESKNYA
jgi:hypothetical protein